jgi:uridine phosphorylase
MTTIILPITGLPAGGVSPAVLVCGDPARAAQIAAQLDDAALLSEKRAYRAYQGAYQGTPVTVCAHGVGAPGAAVAFEELIAAGARRIIRVGTCGALQPHIATGDLVIAHAAVQNSGYGREVAPAGYPAVADPALTLALQAAAAAHGHPCHSGIVLTRDAFYAGVPTPATPDYSAMSEANVLAVEMECAALFLVGSLRGVATAAILAVDGNVLRSAESMQGYKPDAGLVQTAVTAEISIALAALRAADAVPSDS